MYYCEFCGKCPNKFKYEVTYYISQCCSCDSKFEREYKIYNKNFWVSFSEYNFFFGILSKKHFIKFSNNIFEIYSINNSTDNLLSFEDNYLKNIIVNDFVNKIDNCDIYINSDHLFEYSIKKYFDNLIFY